MRWNWYERALILICLTFSFQPVWASKHQSIKQPEVILAVAPVYPALAGSPDISGKVDVKLKINKAGSVIAAQATNGPPLLRKPAEDAARRWRFAATNLESEIQTVLITFLFRIMPKSTSAEELTPIFTPPFQIEVRHLPFTTSSGSDIPTYERLPRRGKKKRIQ